jgi:hypothetical protein
VRVLLDDQADMALDPKHSRHDIYNFVLPRSSLLLDIDLLISLAVVQGCFLLVWEMKLVFFPDSAAMHGPQLMKTLFYFGVGPWFITCFILVFKHFYIYIYIIDESVKEEPIIATNGVFFFFFGTCPHKRGMDA